MADFTGERLPVGFDPRTSNPLDLQSIPYRNRAGMRPPAVPIYGPGQGFIATPFTLAAGATLLLRSAEDRNYMLIQNSNTSAGILYIGIGYAPALGTGLQIVIGGYYEPYTPSSDDIWLFSPVACAGLMLLCIPVQAT
jgi:hypothetical protein